MRLLAILILGASAPAMSSVYAAVAADPADASAVVPVTRYDSAFSGYRTHPAQEPGSWREHNDAMGAVGGHAGHVRGSASSSEPQPSAGSDVPTGATDHGMHKK